MAKSKSQIFSNKLDLFESTFKEVEIVFPLVIKRKDGSMDKCYENGVKESISTSPKFGHAAYIRTKLKFKTEEEYLHYLRRMIFVAKSANDPFYGIGNEDDWQFKMKEIDEMNNKMFEGKLEDEFTDIGKAEKSEEIPQEIESPIFNEEIKDEPF